MGAHVSALSRRSAMLDPEDRRHNGAGGPPAVYLACGTIGLERKRSVAPSAEAATPGSLNDQGANARRSSSLSLAAQARETPWLVCDWPLLAAVRAVEISQRARAKPKLQVQLQPPARGRPL